MYFWLLYFLSLYIVLNNGEAKEAVCPFDLIVFGSGIAPNIKHY